MQACSRPPSRPSRSVPRLYPNAAIPTPRDTEKTRKLGTEHPVSSFRSRLFGHDDGQNQEQKSRVGPNEDVQDGHRVARPFPLYLPVGAGREAAENPRRRSFNTLFEQVRAADKSGRETHRRDAGLLDRPRNTMARARPSPLLRRVLEPMRGGPRPERQLDRSAREGRTPPDAEHGHGTAAALPRPSAGGVPRQLPDAAAESIANLKDRYCELGAALHGDVSTALDDGHAALAERVSAIFMAHRDFVGRHEDLAADFGQPLSESYVYEEGGGSPRDKIFIRDVAAELRAHVAETEKTLAADWTRWDECKAAEERAAAALLDDLRARPEASESLGREVEKWAGEVRNLAEETGHKIKQLEKAMERQLEGEIRARVKLYERTLRQIR